MVIHESSGFKDEDHIYLKNLIPNVIDRDI